MSQSAAALVFCVGTVRLFLSSLPEIIPLYLNWEDCVTVTAVCVTTSACTQPPLSNTRITCDITLLLQGERCRAQAKRQGKQRPKFTQWMGFFFFFLRERIRKPRVAWENYTITTPVVKLAAPLVEPANWKFK